MDQNTVYAVISADKVSERLRKLIDAGDFAGSNKLSYDLKAFYDSLSSFCQRSGGHVYMHLYERSVIQVPSSVADQLPDYLDDFNARFHADASMGIGFSLREAAKAAEASKISGHVELYEPGKNMEEGGNQDSELPPNLFDPANPESPNTRIKNTDPKPPPRPSAEQEAQSEQAFLSSMMPQQPQAPQGQPQPGQQQGQPQSLQEAFTGQPGPQQGQPGQSQGQPKEQVEEAVSEAETEAQSFDGKLASALHQVREQLPKIMALEQQNPKAFKQAMQVVSKLVSAAHKSGVAKREAEHYEGIRAQLDEALSLVKFRGWPVGTTRNGRKKVMVDGRAYWRSVRAGLVQDAKGNAISVKSHNAQAQGKDPNEAA